MSEIFISGGSKEIEDQDFTEGAEDAVRSGGLAEPGPDPGASSWMRKPVTFWFGRDKKTRNLVCRSSHPTGLNLTTDTDTQFCTTESHPSVRMHSLLHLIIGMLSEHFI